MDLAGVDRLYVLVFADGACTVRPAAHALPGKGRMRPFLHQVIM